MQETKIEQLKRLFEENGLVKEDVYKDKRGFVIMTRTGIDKIVANRGINITYEIQNLDPEWVVIKAIGTINNGTREMTIETFGECSPKNNKNAYPVAMAEKRAMSRVVLKLSGFYQEGIYGHDELTNV